MRQDYLYLVDYCRAISLAVAKAGSVEDMGWFASLIHTTLNTEMSLHVGFCGDFGISKEKLESTEPSPTTLAYTRHLIETAYSGAVGEIASSLLPCMGGYSEIGRMLHARGMPPGQPLYARWIKTYSAAEFAELSVRLRSFIDCTALSAGKDEIRKMEEAFIVSSRYEYKFWDAAVGAVAAGHIWPVFLRLHGGKGVATVLGVSLAALALLPTLLVGWWAHSPVAGIVAGIVVLNVLTVATLQPVSQIVLCLVLTSLVAGAHLSATLRRYLDALRERRWVALLTIE